MSDDERDRLRAGEIMRELFPTPELLGTARYAICRARNNSRDNFWYRMRSALRRGVATHALTRERVMILVADLLALIEELFGTPTDWHAASLAEQELDGAEDVAQLRAHDNPAYLAVYVTHARRVVAAELVLIAAAEREIARRAKKIAA